MLSDSTVLWDGTVDHAATHLNGHTDWSIELATPPVWDGQIATLFAYADATQTPAPTGLRVRIGNTLIAPGQALTRPEMAA